VAFVEVKARPDLSQALDALRPRQRARTQRAAEWFLLRHPGHADCVLRFDLVTVQPWRLPRHLVNAWHLE
jgi:putative endonuclease